MEMKEEKIWTCIIGPEDRTQPDELAALASKWGVGLKVEITNPFEVYSRGRDVIFEKKEFC